MLSRVELTRIQESTIYLRAQARSFSTLLQQLRPVPKEGGEEATKVEKNVKMNTIK